MADKPKKLTDKEARFIKEYQVDLNATQAAIRAGYSALSANRIGAENLSKPYIKEALAAEVAVKVEKIDYSAERVLARLAEIAFDENRDSVTTKSLELLAKYHALTDGAGVKKKQETEAVDTKEIAAMSTEELLGTFRNVISP